MSKAVGNAVTRNQVKRRLRLSRLNVKFVAIRYSQARGFFTSWRCARVRTSFKKVSCTKS